MNPVNGCSVTCNYARLGFHMAAAQAQAASLRLRSRIKQPIPGSLA